MKEKLYQRIEEILYCPKTGNKLILNREKQKIITTSNEFEYSIIDDIIDFIPEVSKGTIDNYDDRAKRYEKIFSNPSIFIRLIDKAAWGITHL